MCLSCWLSAEGLFPGQVLGLQESVCYNVHFLPEVAVFVKLEYQGAVFIVKVEDSQGSWCWAGWGFAGSLSSQ